MTVEPRPGRRREIKMLADACDLPEVRCWIRLHGAAFRPLHPPRQINNAYLDTPHLESFEDSLAGVAMKRKLRLRWYGTSARAVGAVVQLKGREGSSGWKVEQAVGRPLDLEGASWSSVLDSIRSHLAGDLRREMDRRTHPIFINQYRREYYVSADRRVRLTLDAAQAVFDQRHSSIVNLARRAATLRQVIVELKAGADDLRLAEVSSAMPLRFEAASKYVMAVEALLAR